MAVVVAVAAEVVATEAVVSKAEETTALAEVMVVATAIRTGTQLEAVETAPSAFATDVASPGTWRTNAQPSRAKPWMRKAGSRR